MHTHEIVTLAGAEVDGSTGEEPLTFFGTEEEALRIVSTRAPGPNSPRGHGDSAVAARAAGATNCPLSGFRRPRHRESPSEKTMHYLNQEVPRRGQEIPGSTEVRRLHHEDVTVEGRHNEHGASGGRQRRD